MKLLVLSESPLEKIGEDYFAVDPWIRIPCYLAEKCEKVTVWMPVEERARGYKLPEGAWKVELGKLNVEHLDYYYRYVQFYRLLPQKYFSWKKRAHRLICDHDVVFIRAPSPIAPLMIKAAQRAGKPVVSSFLLNIATQCDRLIQSRGLKRLMYRTLLRGFIAQERWTAKKSTLVYVYSKELEKRYRNFNTNIRMMQDPHLRMEDFYHREDTCLLNEIRILRLCWLIPSKGVEYLLESIARLRTEGFSVLLEIVGKERNLGYQKTLEQLAEKLTISPFVNFSGWLSFDQTAEAYKRSDIQVLSSLGEGTPRCVVEGFAQGLPLVCTAVGGCKDTLVHERDALLVPPKDPGAIAEAVKRILRDEPLRRKLIREGYQRAKEATFEYAGGKFIRELEDVAQHQI